MSRKNILITGGTGFLGAYLIREFIEAGYTVRAIRRSAKLPTFIPAEILDRVEWVDGDILDVLSLEDAMEGMDAVIHSAAIVSFVKSDRKRMYQVNVDGTANVVNICLEKNISRLLYISSVAALGRTSGGGHVDEERKWEESKINTHYAKSKHKAELEVWRGIAEGLNGVILNPSTILGYGDWNSSSSAIFKTIYRGFKWYTTGINGFVDVRDVSRATRLLLESTINEQRFIVNGDNWSFRKLQDAIADAFGRKRPSREATPALLKIAWRMEAIKTLFSKHRPLLTKESSRVGQSKTYFENAKILSSLPGFSFTPLETTILESCGKYIAAVNGSPV